MTDQKKKPALFIGRWQPFHDGHKALIEKVLKEGQDVIIGIRNTPKDEKNPYSAFQRHEMIYNALSGYKGRFETIIVPDIGSVCYGRDVGYEVREIRLDEATEAISGTNIRKSIEAAGGFKARNQHGAGMTEKPTDWEAGKFTS